MLINALFSGLTGEDNQQMLGQRLQCSAIKQDLGNSLNAKEARLTL
jgi:hypothetical protein